MKNELRIQLAKKNNGIFSSQSASLKRGSTWVSFGIKKCIACIGDLNFFLLGTEHILKCSGSVILSKETNVRLLHEAKDVSSLIDLNKHSEYVKQQSEQWKELWSQCFITGSTMHQCVRFQKYTRNETPLQRICPETERPHFWWPNPSMNAIWNQQWSKLFCNTVPTSA